MSIDASSGDLFRTRLINMNPFLLKMELELARDAKNNKKGFYRYVNQKRKVKESEKDL